MTQTAERMTETGFKALCTVEGIKQLQAAFKGDAYVEALTQSRFIEYPDGPKTVTVGYGSYGGHPVGGDEIRDGYHDNILSQVLEAGDAELLTLALEPLNSDEAKQVANRFYHQSQNVECSIAFLSMMNPEDITSRLEPCKVGTGVSGEYRTAHPYKWGRPTEWDLGYQNASETKGFIASEKKFVDFLDSVLTKDQLWNVLTTSSCLLGRRPPRSVIKCIIGKFDKSFIEKKSVEMDEDSRKILKGNILRAEISTSERAKLNFSQKWELGL